MKCADIGKALSEDAADLKALRRHLESCPDCSRRFARDLEIEEALRNLGLEVASLDITAEVRSSLRLLNRRRSTYDTIRKWVWLTVSVATLALSIDSMPILAGWLSRACDLAIRLEVGQSIDPVISSIEGIYLFCLMVAALAWLAAYLWREATGTVRSS